MWIPLLTWRRAVVYHPPYLLSTVYPYPPPPHPHHLPEQQDPAYDLDLRARSAFPDLYFITGLLWEIARCASPWLTIPSRFPPSTMRM